MADTVVYWFWAITLIVTAGFIVYFATSAWRSNPGDMLYWRRVKMITAALGIVGLFLLLLNFEQLVRSSMVDSANDYAFKTFLEAKFYSTFNASVACAGEMNTQEAKNRCFDFSNLDSQVGFAGFRQGSLTTLKNWQNNPNLNPVIERLNRYIEDINAARPMAAIPPTFKFETRLPISFISTLLVIIAISGGLGEAIYQYKQELDRTRRIPA